MHKAVNDIDSLVRILQLTNIECREIAENPNVDQEAAKRFESLFQVHQNNLPLLTQVWKSVVTLPMGGVTNVLRRLVLRYVTAEKWSPVDENVHAVLLDARIFNSADDFLQVIKILLNFESTCDNLYTPQKLFIKVVQDDSILDMLDVQQLRSLIERGIQSISFPCKCHRTHHEQKIQISLQLQQVINTSDYLEREEYLKQRSDERIHKLLKLLSVIPIFDFLFKFAAKGQSDVQLQFLTDHINNRLCREHENIEFNSTVFAQKLRKNEKDITVILGEKSVASVMKTIANIVFEEILPGVTLNSIIKGEEHCPNFEAIVLRATKFRVFLVMLMETPQRNIDQYCDHSKLRALKLILKQFIESVPEGDITLGFVDKLVKIKHDLFTIISSSRSGQTGIERLNWIQKCETAERKKRIFLQDIESLKRLTEGHLRDICHLANVTDATEISEEVRKHSTANVDKLLLSKIDDPKYWGCLNSLTPLANMLSPLAYSVMFSNVSRSFFEGSSPDLDIVLESKGPADATKLQSENELDKFSKSNNYQEFTDLLCKHCLPIYRQYGFVAATGNLDIPADIILNLVEGIDNENDFDIELSLLSNACDKKIKDEMKSSMISLIKLTTLSQRAKQLKSVCNTFDLTDHTSHTYKALDVITQLSECEAKGTIFVGTIHNAVLKLEVIEKTFTKVEWSIVEELTNCKELVGFLSSAIDDDLRNLI